MDNEIIEILTYFNWNWDLASDHLDVSVNELKNKYSSLMPSYQLHSTSPNSFGDSSLSKESILEIQNFIKENFSESLPILFNKNLKNEEKKKISQSILVEMGLTYKILHSSRFIDQYEALEDEALQLAKWREQGIYLNILEDALFRIAAKYIKEN